MVHSDASEWGARIRNGEEAVHAMMVSRQRLEQTKNRDEWSRSDSLAAPALPRCGYFTVAKGPSLVTHLQI